jgi:hypothetical protein
MYMENYAIGIKMLKEFDETFPRSTKNKKLRPSFGRKYLIKGKSYSIDYTFGLACIRSEGDSNIFIWLHHIPNHTYEYVFESTKGV